MTLHPNDPGAPCRQPAAGVLNLFNGDCACDGWRRSGLPGDVLVWRENYLHGVLPPTDDVDEFCRIRAAELHRIAPEQTVTAIYDELCHMHRRLLALAPGQRLVAWFDLCPFDRTMLARILYLLHSLPALPEIDLIWRDVVWDSAQFRRHCADGVALTRRQTAYGAEQYLAFRHGAKAETLLADLLL